MQGILSTGFEEAVMMVTFYEYVCNNKAITSLKFLRSGHAASSPHRSCAQR